MSSLLEVLEEGACNKTALASRANLATRASTSYINIILTFNLAAKEHNVFKLTDKGRRFLEEYKN